MTADTKQCVNCGRNIKGRSDKKFCDDACRNTYNNQIKSPSSNLVRNINNALAKNRRVLEHLLDRQEMAKVHRDKMLAAQYNFKYHTHLYKNKNGQTYFFVYDHGYLPLENDWVLIVRRKEETSA